MKTTFTKLILICFLMTSMLACQKDNQPSVTSAAGKSIEKTLTAQSVMIDIAGGTEFRVEGNQVWKFDQNAAAMDFGYAACSGNKPCQNEAIRAANASKCALWEDGRKYWNLVQDNGSDQSGTSTLDLNISILGQSWMSNKTFPVKTDGKSGKYSFTMGTTDSSRISNLTISVNGISHPLSHTILNGSQINGNCFSGMTYTANAGAFGLSQSYLKDGVISTILGSDYTSANDNDCPSIGKATFQIPAATGDYQITVSGTIKGNEVAASSTFSSTSVIHISAEGCQ
jgi:hypothetical protein